MRPGEGRSCHASGWGRVLVAGGLTEEITVKTQRLLVRRFAGGDLEDFLSYQDDPEVRRYLPGEPMSRARAAEYLKTQSELDDQVLDAWHGFAVHHVAHNRVIGDVGIWLPANADAAPDVGFQFHPAYHGKGYAHEAVQALLHHVFEARAPARITATCAPANKASQALMKRLGMCLSQETPQTVEYDLRRDQWLADTP